MTLVQLLEKNKESIVREANEALARTPMKSYLKSGKEKNKIRLTSLFETMVEGLEKNNVLIIIKYAETVATERFKSGFEIYEVQTAFNTLEEAVWKKVIQSLEATEVADALRQISTMLGAGKEALANTYVKFSKDTKISAIDQSALFEGTDGE